MNSGNLINRISVLGIIIIGVFFIWVINPVKAQVKIGFGPKGGPNISFFRGNFPIRGMREPIIGLTAGGYLMIRSQSQKRWQFEANVLYTTRGHKATFLRETNKGELKTELSYQTGYIEIPLLLKYMLNKGGMTRPYIFFGPVYSGLIHAKFTDQITRKEENAFEWISRDDFGLMVGWGITSFFIDRWYHLDIRLFNGFFDVSDNLANDLYPFLNPFQERASYYNTTLSLTLGVGLERSETFFLR